MLAHHADARNRILCHALRRMPTHWWKSNSQCQFNPNKPCEQLAANISYSAVLLSQKGSDHFDIITPKQPRHFTRCNSTFEQSLGTRLWPRLRRHSNKIDPEPITGVRHCFQVGVTSRSQQSEQTPAVVVFQEVAKAWKIAPTTWFSSSPSRLNAATRASERARAQALAACCVGDLRACVSACLCARECALAVVAPS